MVISDKSYRESQKKRKKKKVHNKFTRFFVSIRKKSVTFKRTVSVRYWKYMKLVWPHGLNHSISTPSLLLA